MSTVTLAERLHDRARAKSTVYPIGRSFILLELPHLTKDERFQLFVDSARRYDITYCQYMFLSAHELWRDFGIQEWQRIVFANSPRLSLRNWSLDELINGIGYGDIAFIARWLGIDPISLTLSNHSIQELDSAKIIAFCYRSSSRIFHATCSESIHASDSLCYARDRILEQMPECRLRQQTPACFAEYAAELLQDFLNKRHLDIEQL